MPYITVNLISSNDSTILARSGRFKVKSGITTTVIVSRTSSKFIVRFSQPIGKRSIYVQVSGLKELSNHYSNRHNDFLKTSNEWVLTNIKKGNYNIRVSGNDISEIQTNIFVDGKSDKILEINSDMKTNATGIIKGTIHDSSGTPLSAWVHAWEHGSLPKNRFNLNGGHGCVSSAYPKNGDFQLNKLNPQKTYDVKIEIAGLTNYIFKSVVPNEKNIEVITPTAYRVTGTIVNSSGDPVIGQIYISDWLFGDNETSDFELFPVFPGNYTVIIKAPDYPLVKRNITVNSSDVDLGEIVIYNDGIVISGRIIDSNGQPIVDQRIDMQGQPFMTPIGFLHGSGSSTRSNDDGTFEVKNLPSDEVISLRIRLPNYRNFRREIGAFSIDTDIGDIVLRKSAFSIITVMKADGSPAAGLYVGRQRLDKNGFFQGQLKNNSDYVEIYKNEEDWGWYLNGYKVKIPAIDNLTNRITITLPEGF